MSRVLTGDKLVSTVKNKTFVPGSTNSFTDENILEVLNEELDVLLLEKIVTLHEENLMTYVEVPKNDRGVYKIPYRAIGNKIRDAVTMIGNQTEEMVQISLGELVDYSSSWSTNTTNGVFYLQGDELRLVNPYYSFEKVRMYYNLRPSKITKTNRAANISAIAKSGNQITFTLSNVPRFFVNELTYDVVGAKTPNKIKAMDLVPVVSSNFTLLTVTFDITPENQYMLDDVEVGDYLTLAEESPVPNIPTEMHPLLAQLAAVNILEALGDTENLANAERKLKKMEDSTSALIDDRVDLAPKKIKPRRGILSSIVNSSHRNKRY